ncbi:MAG: 4a-hydroxytetrahydrobiopterin dehydratase [bacterium]|nr:4a-hydroxytetrahydrobiopterin dehydratase [bacterium]
MPPLGAEKIKEYSAQLKNSWDVLENKKIRREFVFKGFKEAIVFVNKVAEIAEQEDHHPDIHIFYRKVVIELWTHAVGGLSENDFIMAAKIETRG